MGPEGKEWDREEKKKKNNEGILVYQLENIQTSDPPQLSVLIREAAFPMDGEEQIFHHLENLQGLDVG